MVFMPPPPLFSPVYFFCVDESRIEIHPRGSEVLLGYFYGGNSETKLYVDCHKPL